MAAATIKINSKNTKMVAHRGVSGLERENTALSFTAAGNREKYYGIETDVHRTKDGKYVCIHDGNTQRVSGVDMCIEESTLEEIQSVALYDVDGKNRVDIRVPTLQDYINICHRYGKVSVLELKTPFEPEEIREITDIIRGLGHLDMTVFISFHRQDLVYLREILPKQKAQLLTAGEFTEEIKRFVVEYDLDIDIRWPDLTREAFEEMKALGKEVNVWTVDDVENGERLADMGVDYITTDILE